MKDHKDYHDASDRAEELGVKPKDTPPLMQHDFANLKAAGDRKKIGKHRVRVCRLCNCTEHYNPLRLVKIYMRDGERYDVAPPCEDRRSVGEMKQADEDKYNREMRAK